MWFRDSCSGSNELLRRRRGRSRPHHGRCGEQEPEDAAPEVAWLRRLHPTYLRVLQVRIGGNEPLQEEAQRDPQGESEEDAAEDQEVKISTAEVETTQPEGEQEEDRGEQVRGHDGSTAVAVDGEPFLPVLQPEHGLPCGALDLGYGAYALHEETVVG